MVPGRAGEPARLGSARGEVHRLRAAVAPIASAISASSSAPTALSTVSAISASPPGLRGHLHAGDVDPRLAERGADRADDAGAVGVAEEQQVPSAVEVDVEPVDLGELLDLRRAAEACR